MIQKILVSVALFLTFFASAQQGTASPYSFYGIGEVRFRGTAENRFMGGVSVFSDSIHINLQNPASYAGLKLTSFTIGGSFNSTKFNSDLGNEKAQRSTLDYMAVGLPLGKFGAVFGVLPYSSVGYKIRTEGIDDTGGLIRKYNGSGGVNKAFIGLAYQINPSLSIGADINYNFGSIETTSIKYYPELQFGAEEFDNSEITGVNVNLGAMYKRKINTKIDFYGSLGYTPESTLKSKNERTIASIVYIESNTSTIVDYLPQTNSEVTLKLPSKFSIGAGIGQNRKWLVGTDVTFNETSKMGNRFIETTNTAFENAIRYSVGGYFIPNYNSFSSYFSKVVYRAGLRYENSGLIISNHPIRDRAVTAGLGLPLGGTFSNLNVGVELGRKGTTRTQLVEENYANIILSISLNDKWFTKRRYD